MPFKSRSRKKNVKDGLAVDAEAEVEVEKEEIAPKFLVKILVDNPQEAYFPGQMLTGKACFDLDSELETKGIHFKFSGQAEVNFTKNRSVSRGRTAIKTPHTVTMPNRKRIVSGPEYRNQTVMGSSPQTLHYAAKEEFVQFKFPIGNNDQAILLAGFHEFPFSFKIPLGLPSSYSGENGRVIYLLWLDYDYELQVDMNEEKRSIFGKIKNKTIIKTVTNTKHIETPITIIGILDLKNEPSVELPVEIKVDKTFRCLCCKTGSLSLKLTIPRKGFVPGESIPFLVEINNNTRRKVSHMAMSLIQKVEYYGKFVKITGSGRKESALLQETLLLSEVILKQIGPGIAKRDSGTWDPGSSFKIPSKLLPTKLAGSVKIIDVQYSLHFEAKVHQIFNSPLNIPIIIPIIIGTIPLPEYPADKSSSSSKAKVN